MYQLGFRFDLGLDFSPVDLSGGAVTGKRNNARNAQNVNFVVFKNAEATGTDDPVITVQQHTASSSGTSSTFLVDHYWKKSATTMDNTETWVRVENTSDGQPFVPGSNTVNSTVTLTGEATKQGIYVLEINTKDLKDGCDYVSANTLDAGATAQIGGILTVFSDLVTRRSPSNLQPALF